MKINSENLIKDAQKLRKTQEKPKKSVDAGGNSRPTKKIQLTLDTMFINLKTHQQNIAKLQLETVGLEQIEKSLDFIIKNNPGDFDSLKQAKNEIETAVNASMFQKDRLISDKLQKMLLSDLGKPGAAESTKNQVNLRKDEIKSLLKTEINKINKIQVSFENINSLNMPSDEKIGSIIEDIKNNLTIQQQIQSNVNPSTVLGLLKS